MERLGGWKRKSNKEDERMEIMNRISKNKMEGGIKEGTTRERNVVREK